MLDVRLVQNLSQILHVLKDGKLSVNNMIKETGIYKNKIFDANRFLEKCKLVVRVPDKNNHNERGHKQKIFVELTEFGHKLAGFIESTNKFDNSYDGLKLAIKNNFDGPHNATGKTLRSLLRARGWVDEDMNRFEEYEDYIRSLERDCLSIIIYGIANLYGSYLLRFDPNRSAKDLLQEIMITKLSKYLIAQVESSKVVLRCKHCDAENSILNVDELTEKNSDRLFGTITDYVHIPFSMGVITKDVQDVLKSLFLVMDLPREHVKQKIELELKMLDSCDPNNENIKSSKRLLSYCAELC